MVHAFPLLMILKSVRLVSGGRSGVDLNVHGDWGEAAADIMMYDDEGRDEQEIYDNLGAL